MTDVSAYRWQLSEALQSSSEPSTLYRAALRLLGEYLHVYRGIHVLREGPELVIDHEYVAGASSMTGRHVLARFSTESRERLDAGRTRVVGDVALATDLLEQERAFLNAAGVRSYLSVTLAKRWDLAGALVLHAAVPREWSVQEIELAVETADRTWDAVQRAVAERELRAAAHRDALRLSLADTLRLATDVTDLRSRATRLLGEYLLADRVLLVERDAGDFLLQTDYCGKLPPIPGRYPLSSFSSVSDAFLRGESIVVGDLDTDTTLVAVTRTSFQKVGARAVLAVPLFRSGRLVAALVLHQAVVRHWREQEVALVADAAERIWSALERLHQERALRESEAALREAARNKDAFLAVLAHELRNPLAPLQTSVELMYLAVQDPRMLIEITSIMERQLAHVTRLVDDLLDAARITHGALRIERAPTPLAQILDEATEMHRRACIERGIKVTMTVERAVNVDVDRVRIVQVIANLIHNAVKFTGPRGEIDVRAHVYGKNVILTVQDTGVGIAPELLPFVFELFHGATDERGGLGVGLALSRQLVQLHGGTITVRSREDRSGTAFEIRLPDTVTERPVDAARPVPMPSVMTPRDILIVDDNDDIVRATSILITVLGATPHVATSGADAIELALKVKPIAVLLDINMPALDGYAVCRQLRTMFGPEIRLVAYTGLGKHEDKRRALEAGFDQHITKPAHSDTLARALRLKH